MMKTTDWKGSGTGKKRVRATYGIDYDFARRNNQAPHFSITGETEERSSERAKWREGSFGQITEEIKKYFGKSLGPLLKWHLFAVGEGPMHYIANGTYWLDQGNEEYFKSTIIFGEVPGDKEFMAGDHSKEEVKVWLEERLPILEDKFRVAMKSAGVLE